MERSTLLSNLSSRRRQIEEVKVLISRQRFILAELIIERRSTRAGRQALEAMEAFLRSLIENRAELEAELGQDPISQSRHLGRRPGP